MSGSVLEYFDLLYAGGIANTPALRLLCATILLRNVTVRFSDDKGVLWQPSVSSTLSFIVDSLIADNTGDGFFTQQS